MLGIVGNTSNIGRRIELVSMDPHFHDISIALYQQDHDTGPELMVHTYSGIEGAPQRVAFVTRAMAMLGGMQPSSNSGECLRYPCGATHMAAMKRLFIEACKAPPADDITPRPLHVFDKKSSANVTARSLGEGRYQLSTDGEKQKVADRRAAIAAGLVKLAELEWVDEETSTVAFACGRPHDELVGLLLPRALNVRSFIRQQEMAATKGQLLAPSAQER